MVPSDRPEPTEKEYEEQRLQEQGDWWNKRCAYHPPTTDKQRDAHSTVNALIEQAGLTLIELCPDSDMLEKALDALFLAKMYGNGALAVYINAEPLE